MFNRNNAVKCEVCFNEPPVHIPLIICGHSSTFCEGCIKSWIAEGHSTCPKCRARLPIKNYLKRNKQNCVNIANVSPTMSPYSLSINQNISSQSSPSSSKRTRLVDTVFTGFAIGLLLGLIIYPAVNNV